MEAIFSKWIRKRWLAPNVLKTLYQQDKVQGIYMPYWTFDADTSTDYTAMGGIDYEVEYTDEKGEKHTTIETRWNPTTSSLLSLTIEIAILLISKKSYKLFF